MSQSGNALFGSSLITMNSKQIYRFVQKPGTFTQRRPVDELFRQCVRGGFFSFLMIVLQETV